MTKDCSIPLLDQLPATPVGTPLSQITKSSPIGDVLSSSSSSSSSPSPSRTSPRSPLDCGDDDLIGVVDGQSHTPTAKDNCNSSSSSSSSSKTKKSVLHLEGGGAGVICCSPPTVHIEDETSTTATTTPTSPQRKTTTTTKKVVSFSKRITFREVRHIKEYSPNEIETLWLTPTDYQFNKAVVKSTVLKMMKGEVISDNDPDFSPRGLEYRTRNGARTRNRNKLKTRSAVLNEQEMQFEEGFYDPTYIAMVSEEASQECRDLALARGLWGERSIQDYIKDTRHMYVSPGLRHHASSSFLPYSSFLPSLSIPPPPPPSKTKT